MARQSELRKVVIEGMAFQMAADNPFPPGFPAMKFIDIPPKFFIGHLIGGKITEDIQNLTGAEILFLKGNQGRKPRKLEIRGSLNGVKLAEEFVKAFFKHSNPSQASDGLNRLNTFFLSEICGTLPTDSILREKIMDYISNVLFTNILN